MPEDIYVNPLAIVGNEDVVLGFGALGFSIYLAKGRQPLKMVLPEIINKHIAICLVQEDIYKAEEDEINKYKNLAMPVFIPFSSGAKMELLESMVKDIKLRATGVV